MEEKEFVEGMTMKWRQLSVLSSVDLIKAGSVSVMPLEYPLVLIYAKGRKVLILAFCINLA